MNEREERREEEEERGVTFQAVYLSHAEIVEEG
jgi:hypothetical protein